MICCRRMFITILGSQRLDILLELISRLRRFCGCCAPEAKSTSKFTKVAYLSSDKETNNNKIDVTLSLQLAYVSSRPRAVSHLTNERNQPFKISVVSMVVTEHPSSPTPSVYCHSTCLYSIAQISHVISEIYF